MTSTLVNLSKHSLNWDCLISRKNFSVIICQFYRNNLHVVCFRNWCVLIWFIKQMMWIIIWSLTDCQILVFMSSQIMISHLHACAYLYKHVRSRLWLWHTITGVNSRTHNNCAVIRSAPWIQSKWDSKQGAIIPNICPWSVVCWESSGETGSCRDIESDCGIAGMFSNDVYLCYCTRLFSTPELGSCYIRLLLATL